MSEQTEKGKHRLQKSISDILNVLSDLSITARCLRFEQIKAQIKVEQIKSPAFCPQRILGCSASH